MLARRRAAAVATAGALLVMAIAPSPVGAQNYAVEVIAAGLGNPRGIAVANDGRIYVADAGVGEEGGGYAANGSLLRLTDHPGDDATVDVIADTLPSAISEEDEVTGPVNIAVRGVDRISAVVGGGPKDADPDFDTLLRGTPGDVSVAADIQAYRDDHPQPPCDASADPETQQIWCDNDEPRNATDSNAYGIAALRGGRTLVTDAAGNDLLLVDEDGDITEVARFPNEVVSGTHLDIPEPLLAEPVPTSVAVGPDGAWYVGELKGFPFTPDASRIWRIDPGAREVLCDPEATEGDCTLYADGFTSITGLDFGPDDALYVVEMVKTGVGNLFMGTDFVGGLFRHEDGETIEIAAGALTTPDDVAIAGDGTIYLTNKSVAVGDGEVLALRP